MGHLLIAQGVRASLRRAVVKPTAPKKEKRHVSSFRRFSPQDLTDYGQEHGIPVDRLGQDCHPLQFLRELTQNSIQAIQRTGNPGEIIWDCDWNTFDLQGVKKLCIIDTGDGMTGPEMVEHINALSSSGEEQSFIGNYGLGAKIAGATRNHAGMVYLSWKNGVGTMIHLWRNPEDGVYGLQQQRRSDDTYSDYLEIDDSVKPKAIRGNGTMILLLGNSAEQDTMTAPPAAESASRWAAKYLNSRYFRFPKGLTVKAREGWDFPKADKDRNLLRTLTGQKAYLDQHAQSSGKKSLSDGSTAHWWILKDEQALTNNSGFVESTGHAAALYQDELYEMSTGRSGTARLQEFGVIFGMRQVVIYIEPNASGSTKLTTNTARTALLLNNESLPWSDWAAEFRDGMPKELEDFISDKAAASSVKDHAKTVRERLKSILDLFKLSRYKMAVDGEVLIDTNQTTRGGAPATAGIRSPRVRSSTKSGGSGGGAGNIYSLFEKKDGSPGSRVKADPFPKTCWISVRDGTREGGDLEDRAARYIMDQNILLINADFRVFTDMTDEWFKQLGKKDSVKTTVEEVVRTWFEQALVETVIGIQGLQGSQQWHHEDMKRALSEEALTSAVMQRYHINSNIKRELGSRLGRQPSAGLSAEMQLAATQ